MEFHVFLVRICFCFLLSFFLGIERQIRRRPVGFRTSLLVSIGSFLFVTFSFQVDSGDLTRIAAQVVTGIGFLGAGVIIKDGVNIRGLNTAATLWCAAAIGTLCAAGCILEATTGAIIVLFSNTVLRYLNSKLNAHNINKYTYTNYILTVIHKDEKDGMINDMIEEAINQKFIIMQNFETSNMEKNKVKLMVKFQILSSMNSYVDELIDKIKEDKELDLVGLRKLGEIKLDVEEEV